MKLGGVVVEPGSGQENLVAILAVVGDGAGEVERLDMLEQVEAAILDHVAEGAAVVSAAVSALLNVGVEALQAFRYNRE